MKGHGIRADQADKTRKGPRADERAELPALDRDRIVRVVPAMMIKKNESAEPDAGNQKAREKDGVEPVASQLTGECGDDERGDGRTEYRFGCAEESAHQFEVERLVGD